MRRRHLLATLATGSSALLAGCNGQPIRLTAQPLTYENALTRIQLFTPERLAGSEFTGVLVDSLFADGPVDHEHVQYDRRPYRGGPVIPEHSAVYLTDGSSYYGIDADRVADGSVTGPRYELTYGEDVSTEPSPERTVSLSELPAQDRWRIAESLDYRPLGSVDGNRHDGQTEFVAAYLDDERRETSDLVDGLDASYLRIDDEFVTVSRPDGYFSDVEVFDPRPAALENRHVGIERRIAESEPATVVRYRYSNQHVATDEASFVEALIDRHGYTLPVAELGDAERDLVEEAIDDGEATEEDHDAGTFHRLSDRLPDRFDGEPPLVRYDDEWYFLVFFFP